MLEVCKEVCGAETRVADERVRCEKTVLVVGSAWLCWLLRRKADVLEIDTGT